MPFSAVDPPRDTEAIHDLAKSLSPEGLLQRHGYAPAVGELREDALGCCGIVEVALQVETLRMYVLVRKDVAAGQRRAAHRQRGVQSLIAPFNRSLVGHRRVAPRQASHGSAEALGVHGERRVTLTLKTRLMRGSIFVLQSWPPPTS